MAYSKIEQAYLDGLASNYFPDPVEPDPTLLASADTGITTDGGAYVGTRLNMPKGLNTPENMQAVGNDIPKTVAGVAKGMAQGFVGLPGDLEGIGRIVLNYMGADVNEQTKLPTTQDVKGFLDQYIKLPELQTSDMSNFETAGEWLAPGGQLKAAKPIGKVLKGAVKMTEGLPVGLSIKMVDGTEAILEQAPKIDTPEFKKWFGKSKVTDDSGKPIILYHGTDQSFDTFEGTSWFTTSKSDASNYSNIITPNKDHNPNVMPVYVSIKKPKYLEHYANRQDVEAAKASGKYDGVIVKSVMGSDKSYYITFSPEQVKSAIGNNGAFDPKNPSIVNGAIGTGGAGAATQSEDKPKEKRFKYDSNGRRVQ